jgi:hypothetical protein
MIKIEIETRMQYQEDWEAQKKAHTLDQLNKTYRLSLTTAVPSLTIQPANFAKFNTGMKLSAYETSSASLAMVSTSFGLPKAAGRAIMTFHHAFQTIIGFRTATYEKNHIEQIATIIRGCFGIFLIPQLSKHISKISPIPISEVLMMFHFARLASDISNVLVFEEYIEEKDLFDRFLYKFAGCFGYFIKVISYFLAEYFIKNKDKILELRNDVIHSIDTIAPNRFRELESSSETFVSECKKFDKLFPSDTIQILEGGNTQNFLTKLSIAFRRPTN